VLSPATTAPVEKHERTDATPGPRDRVVPDLAVSGRRRKGHGGQRRNIRNAASAAVAGTVIAGMLLGILAGQFSQANQAAEQIVLDRFTARASLGQNFVESYVGDLQRRIQVLGETMLSGPSPTAADLDIASKVLEFRATVLLDGSGRLLQVFPEKPSILGQDMTLKYDHLRRAVAGQKAISGVVMSAANNEPIVAFAVPFDTPYGPRVLSGGFDAGDTPLAAFLTNSSTIQGASAHVVDEAGNIVVADNGNDRGVLSDRDPELARALTDAPAGVTTGTFDLQGVPTYYTVRTITGSPWRIVLAAPIEGLFKSLEASRSGPRTMFAGFAAAAALIVVLMTRIVYQRGDYASASEADALTGVANRRHLHRQLDQLESHDGVRFAVLMIDIDHFKLVNDRLGHQAGDVVLCRVAALIEGSIRPADTLGRWGGEEFMVLLPGTDLPGSLLVAERIRENVAGASLTDDAVAVTISIGAAASIDAVDARRGSAEAGPDAPITERADAALYRAKHEGRNRVVADSR
jgi:diguanylate cyclase (GGDEF)-like protein